MCSSRLRLLWLLCVRKLAKCASSRNWWNKLCAVVFALALCVLLLSIGLAFRSFRRRDEMTWAEDDTAATAAEADFTYSRAWFRRGQVTRLLERATMFSAERNSSIVTISISNEKLKKNMSRLRVAFLILTLLFWCRIVTLWLIV